MRASLQVAKLILLIQQQKQNQHPELELFVALKRVMFRRELRLEKHLQKNDGQRISAVSY